MTVKLNDIETTLKRAEEIRDGDRIWLAGHIYHVHEARSTGVANLWISPDGKTPADGFRDELLLPLFFRVFVLKPLPRPFDAGDVIVNIHFNTGRQYKVIHRHSNGDLFIERIDNYPTPHVETGTIRAAQAAEYRRADAA